MCFYLFFPFRRLTGIFCSATCAVHSPFQPEGCLDFLRGPPSLVGRIFLPLASLLAPQIVSLVSNGHHEGYQKTLRRLSRNFFWVGMMKHVLDFVAACPTCQRNKVETFRPAGSVQLLPVPHHIGRISPWISWRVFPSPMARMCYLWWLTGFPNTRTSHP